MAGTNPNYVPQAGDIFGTPCGAVTVASGSGHTFLDTEGRGFDTQSLSVGIQSTPNVNAVATLAAAGGNAGSGVITGVSVSSPAIGARGPGGAGPYTITYVGAGEFYSVTNAADDAVGFNIGVIALGGASMMADAATLSGPCPIIIESVPVPTTISFLGIAVQIAGSPTAGDSFTVTPAA